MGPFQPMVSYYVYGKSSGSSRLLSTSKFAADQTSSKPTVENIGRKTASSNGGSKKQRYISVMNC
jgi:hypothetical protein